MPKSMPKFTIYKKKRGLGFMEAKQSKKERGESDESMKERGMFKCVQGIKNK